MDALIKTDAFGKQHRVYRISEFDLTAFLRDLTTIFQIHAYVDTEFKYLVIEKVRYDGGKRCVYRTVPIHNMANRVIHGFYVDTEFAQNRLMDSLMDSLMEEFLAFRLCTNMSYLRRYFSYKKQRSILELISVFPNSTSEELIVMAKQL